MSITTSTLLEPSTTIVNNSVNSPKLDDSEMAPIELDKSNVPDTAGTMINPVVTPTDVTIITTPVTEPDDLLADLLLKQVEKLVDAKWSRDVIEHDEALEKAAQMTQLYEDLVTHIKACNENIASLKEQCDHFRDIATDLRSQLDALTNSMKQMLTSRSSNTVLPSKDPHSSTRELSSTPHAQLMHCVSIDGQDVLIYEIHTICPPSYTFYHHFDLKHTEVNGEWINPIWRHGVALLNLFFVNDHTEEILFPKKRTLCCAKEPFWFNLVCNYLHSPTGVSFYVDIFWLEYQHESGHPTMEAVELHTEFFNLKGGSGSIKLLVDDL